MAQMYRTVLTETQIDQTVMLAHMVAKLQERDIYDTDLISSWPAITSIHAPTFIGSFTWTCQAEKWKLMSKKSAISTPGGWASPAELARNYIAIKYPKRRRVTTAQYHEIMRKRQQPLLAIPGTYGDCVYLDLKSAYWSILKVIGWDVEYFPGHWLGVKSDVSDFPYEDYKLARNSLVSVGLVGNGKMWTGEKLIAIKKANPFTNMALWSAVQDTLNGVASDMEKAGALYINTDGYIFRRENMETAFQVAEDWGLTLSIKNEGAADVIAAGTYSIGMKKNNRVQNIRPTYYRQIDDTHKDWLKPRFSKFSLHKASKKVD